MTNNRADLSRVRLSGHTVESQWEDALEGSYGQVGYEDCSLVLIKNVLFIQLYDGCKVDMMIPTVHDGFLTTNKNRIIDVRDSHLRAELESDENASGFMVMKKWN